MRAVGTLPDNYIILDQHLKSIAFFYSVILTLYSAHVAKKLIILNIFCLNSGKNRNLVLTNSPNGAKLSISTFKEKRYVPHKLCIRIFLLLLLLRFVI